MKPKYQLVARFELIAKFKCDVEASDRGEALWTAEEIVEQLGPLLTVQYQLEDPDGKVIVFLFPTTKVEVSIPKS